MGALIVAVRRNHLELIRGSHKQLTVVATEAE
jgi:hypothetical protein